MKLFLIAACALILLPALRADDATKMAKIDQILTLTHTEQLITQQQEAAKTMMHQMITKQAPAGSEAKIAEVEKAVSDELEKALQWSALKGDFVKIYADTFTDEELDGLVKFYQSSTGVALINKTPVVMSKAMTLMQGRMELLMPHLQQRMQSIIDSGDKPTPAH